MGVVNQKQMDQEVGQAYIGAMGEVLERTQMYAIVWHSPEGITWYWSNDAGWVISPNNSSYFPYLQHAKRKLIWLDVVEANIHPVYTYIAKRVQL